MAATHVILETEAKAEDAYEQLDLFTDYAALQEEKEKETAEMEKERKMQKAMLEIKQRIGKNAILKGMNLQDGATAKDRNRQIGGHKA